MAPLIRDSYSKKQVSQSNTDSIWSICIFVSFFSGKNTGWTLLSGSGSGGSSLGIKQSTLLSDPCLLWPLLSNRWGLLRAATELRITKTEAVQLACYIAKTYPEPNAEMVLEVLLVRRLLSLPLLHLVVFQSASQNTDSRYHREPSA